MRFRKTFSRAPGQWRARARLGFGFELVVLCGNLWTKHANRTYYLQTIARSGDLKDRPYQPGVSMNLADSLEKRTTALTVSDVAKVLHVSVRQVYSLVASNKISHIRVGGSIRFDPCEFAVWLRQKMIKTVASSTGRNHESRPSVGRLSRPAARSSQAPPKVKFLLNFPPAESVRLKGVLLVSSNTASLSGTLALFLRAVLERKNAPPDFHRNCIGEKKQLVLMREPA